MCNEEQYLSIPNKLMLSKRAREVGKVCAGCWIGLSCTCGQLAGASPVQWANERGEHGASPGVLQVSGSAGHSGASRHAAQHGLRKLYKQRKLTIDNNADFYLPFRAREPETWGKDLFSSDFCIVDDIYFVHVLLEHVCFLLHLLTYFFRMVESSY